MYTLCPWYVQTAQNLYHSVIRCCATVSLIRIKLTSSQFLFRIHNLQKNEINWKCIFSTETLSAQHAQKLLRKKAKNSRWANKARKNARNAAAKMCNKKRFIYFQFRAGKFQRQSRYFMEMNGIRGSIATHKIRIACWLVHVFAFIVELNSNKKLC